MNNLDMAQVLIEEAEQAYKARQQQYHKRGYYPTAGLTVDGGHMPPKTRVIENLKLARRMLLVVMDEVRRQ